MCPLVWQEGTFWHRNSHLETAITAFCSEPIIFSGSAGKSGELWGMAAESAEYPRGSASCLGKISVGICFTIGDWSQLGFCGAERGALSLRNLSRKVGEAESAWEEGNALLVL